MSPAMIVLAGSSVVGATLRAKTRLPPFFGVPDAELVLLETDDDADEEELPLLDDPPHAASTALRPNAAAPPWPPRISRSRRVSSLSRYGMSGSFRSESAREKSRIIEHNCSGSKLVSIAGSAEMPKPAYMIKTIKFVVLARGQELDRRSEHSLLPLRPERRVADPAGVVEVRQPRGAAPSDLRRTPDPSK